MRLTNVSGHVHGRDYDIDINPVTLLVGDNEAGKSTALGLVHLAMCVRSSRALPVVGTHETDWEAQAVFADPKMRISRGHSGSDKWLLVNNRPQKLRAGTQLVRDAVGEASVWRVSEFQEMSSAKQAAYVMDTVLRDHKITVADVIEKHPGSKPLFEGVLFDANALPTLTRAQKKAHDDKLAAARELKSIRGALTRGEEEMRERGDAPGGTLAYWRTQRDETQARIEEMAGKVGAANGNATAITTLTDKVELLTKAVVAAEAAAEELPALEAAVSKAEAWAKSCTERYDAASEAMDAAQKASAYATHHNLVMRPGTHASTLLEQAIAGLVGEDGDGHLEPHITTIRHAMCHLEEDPDALGKERRRLKSARDMMQDAHTQVARAKEPRDAAAKRAAQLAHQTAQLDAATAELNAIGDIGDIGHLELALGAEREALKDIVAKLDRIADDEALAKAQAQRYEEEARLLALGGLLADRERLARDVRAEVLSEAMEPLAEPVTRITKAAIGCTVDIELDPFGIYLVRTGECIPLDTASNSQQIITWMAFAAAVVSRMDGYRAVLVDDLEALTPARLAGFVRAMAREVEAGHIDQFIGAVASDKPIDVPDATTIWMESGHAE